jgi:oxygen-independent coproporphyrinogen-3 oxidase
VLLEIRTRTGLAIDVLKQLGVYQAKVVAGLIADELVDPKLAIQGRLSLTQKGRLLADSVVRSLLV